LPKKEAEPAKKVASPKKDAAPTQDKTSNSGEQKGPPRKRAPNPELAVDRPKEALADRLQKIYCRCCKGPPVRKRRRTTSPPPRAPSWLASSARRRCDPGALRARCAPHSRSRATAARSPLLAPLGSGSPGGLASPPARKPQSPMKR
jgi:hypothetical protein